MNRGSKLNADILFDLLSASMRPRFMNRGRPPLASADTTAALRFNEAPIHESGKAAVVSVPVVYALLQ